MKVQVGLGALVVVSGVFWGSQLASDRAQAVYSYLFGFVYVLTLVVGTLFLLMIGHATNAKWFVPLRRPCECVVSTLPLLVLALLPVLLFVHDLYPWTDVHSLPPLQQHHVEQKLAWLNVPFFVSRSLGYVAVFASFGELLCWWSRRQDACTDERTAAALRQRMVKLSIAGLVVVSLVFTFASWDWVMSLEPAWYSNLFGVYLFAGGFLSALGLLGVMSVIARQRGRLPRQISSSHYHAIGRLQLAMLIFWAYIGWCHVLQQWIANIPAEALWHLKRWQNGWQWQGLLMVALHFVLPFLLLLSRPIKRNPRTFVGVSAWLLMVHAIDVHYLILPALHAEAYQLSWLDAVALIGLSALFSLCASWRGRSLAPFPDNDPLLAQGLRYESPS